MYAGRKFQKVGVPETYFLDDRHYADISWLQDGYVTECDNKTIICYNNSDRYYQSPNANSYRKGNYYSHDNTKPNQRLQH